MATVVLVVLDEHNETGVNWTAFRAHCEEALGDYLMADADEVLIRLVEIDD